MAEIKGISLPGMITPNGNDANEFPTHEDIYGKGGLMAVNNISEIKSARLKPNMIASTPNGLFRYTGSKWEEISGLGKDTVGSESLPIYLNEGTPTQITINDISSSGSTGTSGNIGNSGDIGTPGNSGNTGIEAIQPYVVRPTIAYPILVSNSGIKSNSKITTDKSGNITASGFKVTGSTGFLKADGSVDDSTYLTSYTDTDTKNTAGATSNTDKLFLIGAQTQGDNPQTYSNINVYQQSGTLSATAFKVGEKCTIKYDSANECIKFEF